MGNSQRITLPLITTQHLDTTLIHEFLSVGLFSLSVDDDQEGVLDGLMEALNTGSAFRDPSRPLRKKAPGGKKGNKRFDFV